MCVNNDIQNPDSFVYTEVLFNQITIDRFVNRKLWSYGNYIARINPGTLLFSMDKTFTCMVVMFYENYRRICPVTAEINRNNSRHFLSELHMGNDE